MPAGPSGGVELHVPRFEQTSGGRSVLWSQIEVTIGGPEVRLISATVVPVKRGRRGSTKDLNPPRTGGVKAGDERELPVAPQSPS